MSNKITINKPVRRTEQVKFRLTIEEKEKFMRYVKKEGENVQSLLLQFVHMLLEG